MPPGKKYAGKHTIAAWGFRLGCPKGDYAEIKEAEAMAHGFTDEEAIKRYVWGAWSQDMHDYMIQDCETNLALWQKLRVDRYSQAAIDLEHRAAYVCDAINEAGVPFNKKKAGELHATLIDKKAAVEKRLVEEFGSWEVPLPDFIPKRDNKKLGYVKGVPVKKSKKVTFNPGSRDNIIKVLLDRGWQPTKYTEGGKPQIDEEVIDGIVATLP
jgi:DNA polymerase-1